MMSQRGKRQASRLDDGPGGLVIVSRLLVHVESRM